MIRPFLLTLVFTFLVAEAASSRIRKNPIDREWLEHAEEIEKSLDPSQLPCNDFFEFACGGWKKNHPIPPNEKYWDQQSSYEKDLEGAMIDILQTPSSGNDSYAYESLRAIYRNCMNENLRQVVGLGSLKNFINKIGGWLMASPPGTELSVNGQVMNTIISHANQLFGIGVFFDVTVKETPWVGNTYRLYLEPAEIPLEHILKDFAEDSPELTLYRQKIKKILYQIRFNNVTLLKPHGDEDVRSMIEFQKSLIQIRTHAQSTAEVRTIKHFQRWYDELSPKQNANASWLDFFNVILKPVNISINSDTKIVVDNLEYVQHLVELLDYTPIRTISNFVVWSIFYRFMEYLPQNLVDIRHDLDNIGKVEPSLPLERKVQCIQDLPFQKTLRAEFVKRHLTDSRKNSVNDIIANISETSKDFIGQTTWLNSSQQQVARDEIAKLKWDVGYPTQHEDVSVLSPTIDEDFGNFHYKEGNYIHNRLQINRFKSQRELSRLNMKSNEVQTFPKKMTDFHTEYRQDLSIPLIADYLLQPIFKPSYPMSINYGSLGTTIGHEISHLFDSSNVRRDDEISRAWSESTYNDFDSRAECFEKKYDEYFIHTSPNSTVQGDGGKSLHENIADYLGTKIAFLAYEKNKEPKDKTARLPNRYLYDDRQLFFISFANKLCSSETPEYYTDMQKKASFEHSFNKFRVNGVVSNMKEFSDAFSCPAHSPMNSQKKCKLYGPES